MNSTDFFLYIGVYGDGVYAYRYNANGAALEPMGLVGKIKNPSFLATDREYKHLYAVSERMGPVAGGVGAFDINRQTGQLKFLNTASSDGEAPCHLTVDHTGRMLMVANYGTGSVAVFELEKDGRLGEMSGLMTAHGSSVNPKRQKGPHAHEVVVSADNRLLYVPDLGLDQIRIYGIDTNTATLAANNPPHIHAEPGSGPRHIAFSSDERFAYVIHELKPIITVFAHDVTTGILRRLDTVSTVPPDFAGEADPAEIIVAKSDRFLYGSNRTAGTIAVFAIDEQSGKLSQIQVIETGGPQPRAFEIDPSGRFLFVGDQKKNEFRIFTVDISTGKLSDTGRVEQLPSPVCFLFVPAV
jgi:6-phosphogluconolactonase